MKAFGKKILTYVIVATIIFLATTILTTYFKDKSFAFNPNYALSGTTLTITILAMGAFFVHDLLKLMDGKGKKKDKAIDKVKDEKGKDAKQFFSRDFVDDETLKKEKAYNYNTLSTIRSCKKDGILVRAEEKGNNMHINFVQPIHTLCVGTTSSGKTSRFVVPTLQLMSMTAAKPSFVVTDPKGELYEKCANKLKTEGYDVKVFNLRDPFSSVQWNPLTYAYDLYHRSFNLSKEVKVHGAGDNPKHYNLMLQKPFDF